MTKDLRTLLSVLQRSFWGVQGRCVLGALAILWLFLTLFHLPLTLPIVMGFGSLCGLFLARKISAFLLARTLAQQLRFEAQFVQYCPSAAQFRQCFAEPQHLWSESRILQAVQVILARQLLHLPDAQARTDHIRHQYRRALGGMRLSRFNYDVLLLLGFGVAWWLLMPEAVRTWATLQGQATLTVGFALLSSELIQARWQWQLSSRLDALERALTDWTEQAPWATDDMASPTYQHTLHYRASAWFGQPPLRDVA